MPSANGVYSLPVGYLAVTGTTIQASQHNPPLEDIAAALTGRLSRDGTAPMTGVLKVVDGAVGAPGLEFASDGTTGLYKTSGGFGVAVGGVKVAEFVAGGIVGARFVGELIPWTGTAAPGLTVLTFGQTLNRITYAALWTFAQTEIAAGNTLYNNGDGFTTFGVPDLRGRVLVPWDKMGGSAAGRVTTAGGGIDGTLIGPAGGGQNQTLTLAQLPTGITSAGTVTVFASGSTSIFVPGSTTANTFNPNFNFANPGGAGNIVPALNNTWAQITSWSGSNTLTSNNTSGNAHPIMQPSIVTNYLLFAGA